MAYGENSNTMKKTTKVTNTLRRIRAAVLTEHDLTAAVGAHNGTIVVESALPREPETSDSSFVMGNGGQA